MKNALFKTKFNIPFFYVHYVLMQILQVLWFTSTEVKVFVDMVCVD